MTCEWSCERYALHIAFASSLVSVPWKVPSVAGTGSPTKDIPVSAPERAVGVCERAAVTCEPTLGVLSIREVRIDRVGFRLHVCSIAAATCACGGEADNHPISRYTTNLVQAPTRGGASQ